MIEQQNSALEDGKYGLRHAVWGVAIVAVIISVLGGFVQLLWNWLMPVLFGLKNIAYLQAVGLLLLSRLLFGRVGQRRDHSGYLTGRYGFRSVFGHVSSQENPGAGAHS